MKRSRCLKCKKMRSFSMEDSIHKPCAWCQLASTQDELAKVEGQRDWLRDELAALREKHGLCIDCGDESPFGDTACCLTCLEKHNKAIQESEG